MMPEIEEPSINTLRIWEKGIKPTHPMELFIRLIKDGVRRPRLVLCSHSGDTCGSGNLLGFRSDGSVDLYGNVTKRAEEVGIKLKGRRLTTEGHDA